MLYLKTPMILLWTGARILISPINKRAGSIHNTQWWKINKTIIAVDRSKHVDCEKNYKRLRLKCCAGWTVQKYQVKKIIIIISKKVKQWISNSVSNQTEWFTAADVQGQIRDRLLVSVPLHQIRKHLKSNEGQSYKKGNLRPLNLDMIRVELLRRLFWVRIAKSISGIKMLVNIDESSVTKGTTKNYSWMKTGRSCSITNVKFRSSINMITAITTNGLAINMLKFWSTTAEILKVLLDYMLSYLIAEGMEPQDIGIILDNCPIHRARLVREYCKCKGARLFYLPQYSPKLAPVEIYFSKIKHLIIQEIQEDPVDLRTEETISKIAHWIHNIDPDYIRRL